MSREDQGLRKETKIVTIDKDGVRAAMKKELAARVEAATRSVSDTMKTRTYHKQDKTCSQCNKKFEGTGKADVCGPTCRKRKERKGN